MVVTSVNAAERLLAALPVGPGLAAVRLAAVGPATADVFGRAGFEPDLVPAEHTARALVAAFPDAGGASSRRVLFPCADRAPDTVPAGLARKGWEVHRVEAYRTVPRPPPAPDLVARVTGADALVLTAASAVQEVVALRGPDGRPVPLPACVVCVGPTTAAASRTAGLRGVTEAGAPTPEGIVAELARRFDDPPGEAS